MEFTIPCETFARLNHAAMRHDEPGRSDRLMLRSIRIEYHNGSKFAVACNGNILACEMYGETLDADRTINIVNDPALISQCEKEAQFGATLTIALAGNWGAAQTNFGYFHPTNVFEPTDWPDWRSRIPDPPRKSSGAAVFNARDTHKLALASPSGQFIFPRVIDATQPIIVRDPENEHWFGMFLCDKENERYKPAEFPTWINPE